MNQRAELVLELLYNGHTYRLNVPFGAAFDDAKSVAESFCQKIEELKQNELARQQQQAQPAQSDTTNSGTNS